MATKIILARAYCDEHLGECWQAYNTATMQTECVPSYTEKTQELKAQGYTYTGHRAGQYTYTLYKAAPLALPIDWQFINDRYQAMDDARQAELMEQDW